MTRNGYSLRRLHKAEPPDFQLMLIQDGPSLAELTALGAARIDWSGMQDVVPVFDAFEAAP